MLIGALLRLPAPNDGGISGNALKTLPSINDTEVTQMNMRLRGLLIAACLIAGTSASASAQSTCGAAIEKTKSDWRAIHLQPASKPGAMSQGVDGHKHIQAAVDSMTSHMSIATEFCKGGKDHEAMLHLDVVRAFLNLPEVQHPTDHRFLLDNKAK